MRLRRFLSNRRAAAPGGIVYVLVSMMVTILVGIFIVNALTGSVQPDTTWTQQANATWATVQSNIWLAFGLVAIGIIIMGAIAILSIMRGPAIG